MIVWSPGSCNQSTIDLIDQITLRQEWCVFAVIPPLMVNKVNFTPLCIDDLPNLFCIHPILREQGSSPSGAREGFRGPAQGPTVVSTSVTFYLCLPNVRSRYLNQRLPSTLIILWPYVMKTLSFKLHWKTVLNLERKRRHYMIVTIIKICTDHHNKWHLCLRATAHYALELCIVSWSVLTTFCEFCHLQAWAWCVVL